MTRVVILFLLVIVTLGAGYYLIVEHHPEQTSQSHLLLGGLASQSNSLTQITIENTEGPLFKARREGEQWLATHLDSVMTFPVDVETLAGFVSALSQAHIIEPKTAKASRYALLGVEPVTQPGAQSTLLTIATGTQQWRVVLGNLASSGLGRYTREPSQQQSYLIDETLPLPLTPYEWLLPDVIDAGLTTLKSIVIDNDPAFTLYKDTDGNWQLSENKLPLAYPGVLAHTLNDIVNFEYDSVAPLINVPAAVQLRRTIDITAEDGKLLTMTLYQMDDDEGGYSLLLTGDLVAASLTEWMFRLTDFQARGLLTPKAELLQQPGSP